MKAKVNKTKLNFTAKPKPSKTRTVRSSVINKQLTNLTKTGGFFDKRLAENDKDKTDKEKLLQRHVIEKLRQTSDISYEATDTTDPLYLAAFNKQQEFFNEDEFEGGISGDIVDQEFFSGGNEIGQKINFKDVLTEKIAATKLERMKRVEENEERREKLRTVDMEWSKNIRFILSKFNFSSNHSNVNKSTKNMANVSALLEQLNSDKKLVPMGANEAFSQVHSEKQINKLQTLLQSNQSRSIDLRDKSTISKMEQSDICYLLRVLINIPNQESAVTTFIIEELQTVQIRRLKDIIRLLFLLQLLLEFCQTKYDLSCEEKLVQSKTNSNSTFIPEVLPIFVKILKLASSSSDAKKKTKGNLLTLRKTMVDVDFIDYNSLDIKLCDSPVQLSKEQIPLIRLACLKKLFELIKQTFSLYSKFLPSCLLLQLFVSIKDSLNNIRLKRYPALLKDQLLDIVYLIENVKNSEMPARLRINSRLTILSSDQNKNAKVLKNIGLVPQLEPDFQETFGTRQAKNSSSNNNARLTLKRKINREKRGAMRDIRRDAEYIAAHQLKIAKENDAMRELKTKAIISSMRSVED